MDESTSLDSLTKNHEYSIASCLFYKIVAYFLIIHCIVVIFFFFFFFEKEYHHEYFTSSPRSFKMIVLDISIVYFFEMLIIFIRLISNQFCN